MQNTKVLLQKPQSIRHRQNRFFRFFIRDFGDVHRIQHQIYVLSHMKPRNHGFRQIVIRIQIFFSDPGNERSV